ncbi:FtsX-like permease family protein [Chloroflexi bacterium TSY]|nr:FtsX-like permease family protein [Chloroflexi bacterium TSY]
MIRAQGWAILVLTMRRLTAQFDLTLTSLLGMASVAILVMSIPIYVDAVYNELLQAELSGPLAREHAPFTLLFHRVGHEAWPLSWQDIQDLDGYLTGPALSTQNLPQQIGVRLFKSDRFGLFAQNTTDYESLAARLANVQFGWISDLAQHIDVIEGHLPEPGEAAYIDVLVAEAIVLQTGVQVGEIYTAFSPGIGQPTQIPVRITGVWRPKDPYELFWFREPANFDDVLFVPEATFAGALQGLTGGALREALWYFVVDSATMRVSTASRLIDDIRQLEQTAITLLPNTFVTSPIDLLYRFQVSARALSIQLFIFSIPIFGLNLVFIGLITGMSIQRRQGEIAVMRSRGATRRQVVGMASLEGLVLAICALVLALPGSLVAARLAMQSHSFLDIRLADTVPLIALNQQALWAGAAALACGIITYTVMTIDAARHTIVTFGWDRARQMRAPLWMRAGLDLLLLIPAAYGVYLLEQQGSLLAPESSSVTQNPFENPLLFLVPFLMVTALTLLLIRLLPPILAILARLVAASSSISLLFAIRHLARTSGHYATPMALLTITLSLAVFLSATTQTFGEHLTVQVLYQAGADLVLLPEIDTGESEDDLGPTSTVDDSIAKVPDWYYVPMNDYLKVPGIEQISRIGRFPAMARQTHNAEGTLLGVDRIALAHVAFWKSDFADRSLGALMNELAQSPNGVLLPSDFMEQNALSVGDPLVIVTDVYGYGATLNLQVVGRFDLFPTWNPRWGPLFVLNLPYLFEQIGLEVPTILWVKTNPAANLDVIQRQLGELNPYISIRRPFFANISAEREQPERQGLLGLLSVGIVFSALLATVGFLMYVIYSISRRSVELGILRSIGLSAWQLIGYLSWELVILVAISLAVGTRLGILVSQLWIPYFKIGNSDYAQLLPISVHYSWTTIVLMYILFGFALIANLAILARLAHRLRLFEIVKMGDIA